MINKIPARLDTLNKGQNTVREQPVNANRQDGNVAKQSSLIKRLSDNQQKSFNLDDILTANYNNNQWQQE